MEESYRVVSRIVAAEVHRQDWILEHEGTVLWQGNSLKIERVVLTADSQSVKTELEEADPNPGGLGFESKEAVATIWRLSSAQGWMKTELEEADPNPGGLRYEGDIFVEAARLRRSTSSPADCLVAVYSEDSKLRAPWVDPSNSHSEELAAPLRTFKTSIDLSGLGHGHSEEISGFRDLIRSVEVNLLEAKPAQERLGDLCSRPTDDHDDSFACSTALAVGRPMIGELLREEMDDIDVFHLTIDEITTLRFKAEAASPIRGTVYNRTGRRLGGQLGADGFEFVMNLDAGKYFWVIQGENAALDSRYKLVVTRR